MTNYLKIGKATELVGQDRKLYRLLEIMPGFLSLLTLLGLLVLSYIKPVFAAYFLIAFDVYWLLLVIYLGIHLIISFRKLKRNLKIDWKDKCDNLKPPKLKQRFSCRDIYHLIYCPLIMRTWK